MQATKSRRINPLKQDALTSDTIKPGEEIKYWEPGNPSSVHRVTILCLPYITEEGDMAVDVRHRDGHESVELTSAIGLTGDRFTGLWSAIAIPNDEE